MRLPTVTAKQVLQEQARATHEAIWFAHQAWGEYLWPGTAEPRKATTLHNNLHSFWIARGFKLSVKVRRSDRRIVLTLTLAPAIPRRIGYTERAA
jgi:hypothetical protein